LFKGSLKFFRDICALCTSLREICLTAFSGEKNLKAKTKPLRPEKMNALLKREAILAIFLYSARTRICKNADFCYIIVTNRRIA